MKLKIRAKIEESRLRSLLKTLTSRIFEVLADTFIFGIFIKEPHLSLFLAIIVEIVCAIVHYINERLWNLTDFGRKIRNGTCKKCGERIDG